MQVCTHIWVILNMFSWAVHEDEHRSYMMDTTTTTWLILYFQRSPLGFSLAVINTLLPCVEHSFTLNL